MRNSIMVVMIGLLVTFSPLFTSIGHAEEPISPPCQLYILNLEKQGIFLVGPRWIADHQFSFGYIWDEKSCAKIKYAEISLAVMSDALDDYNEIHSFKIEANLSANGTKLNKCVVNLPKIKEGSSLILWVKNITPKAQSSVPVGKRLLLELAEGNYPQLPINSMKINRIVVYGKGPDDYRVSITNAEDIEAIKTIFATAGRGSSDSIPACPFNVPIVFSEGFIKNVVLLGTDGCGIFQCNGKYYELSREGRNKLFNLLKKLGVSEGSLYF